MMERMYIEIADGAHRIISVPRAGAIVTETSEVKDSKQVPVTRLHYANMVVKVVGVGRRDVVDALESGVGISGAWTMEVATAEADVDIQRQQRQQIGGHLDELVNILNGRSPDPPDPSYDSIRRRRWQPKKR